DVRAVLGEGPGAVLEQARAVPGVDRDLDPEALRAVAVPRDVRQPLRVAPEGAHVRTVVAVDRDPAAERDVADDSVAGHRRAALREPDEYVLDSVHLAPRALAGRRQLRLRRLERDGLLLRDLCRLQALDHLLDDLGRGELPRAERDVEVLGLAEAGLADHLREHRGAGQLPVRQVLLLQGLLERVASLLLGLLAGLAGVPLPDLVPRPGRGGEREPVARRPAAAGLRGQDLDEVPARELIVERDDPAVDLRAHRPVADVRVHGVGEVDRRRPGRPRLHL